MTAARTGFVSQTHSGDATLENWIARGGAADFDFVEVYMDGATNRRALDPQEVAARADDHDLDVLVHLPFVDLDLGTPRDGVRDAAIAELEACLRVAADMDAAKAVVHPSSRATPPEWNRDVVVPRIVDAIADLDAVAADHGVELCAENLPGGYFLLSSFDPLLEGTEVSMTFDTGHARVDGYDAQAMAEYLDAHRDRVSHVHVNDAREAADEHVPTGSGTTDFATALAPLDDDWDGTLSLEVYTFDFDYLEISREKLHAVL
ncbi:sugar phosphate isomerase/epimerase [Halorubellus sp. JP-L1]|uniref:sugar phosphate isomerase/epimerase family protein n=1 Tax=Halorubellus sp. JP-L1 TaxID=2715753 RepID=UPI00140E90F1|nr:sugar phosphate isomerase/epimerase family protein [Halorubellus sp. JP-L1]NHN42712.1 sugar phosphate isomerase/epimerase [Halorubellus sp. JP-L1]